MDSQNKILTIFEYTSQNYETVLAEMDAALKKSAQLREENAELSKLQSAQSAQLAELNEKWRKFNETLDSNSTKEAREEFEKTKVLLEETTAAQAKLTAKHTENTKVIEKENKVNKTRQKILTDYMQVMGELQKGIDKVTSSEQALGNARKYLEQQLKASKQDTEHYAEVAKQLGMVSEAYDQVIAKRKVAVAQGKAEANTIEAMRERVAALNKAWKQMDRDKPEFKTLTKELREATDELKAAEAEVGIFSRNVGNYKSGFDGLSFSLVQITREAPAFANSLQTGFMAISNNIPIFIDELVRAQKANKMLNAEGIKTPSVAKQVVKALFSWQTALSAAVVVLTVFGKAMVEWVIQLAKGRKGLDEYTFAQKQMDAALLAGRNGYAAEITNLELLYEASQDATRSYQDRLNAVEALQRQYPDYFGNLTAEKILAGETSDVYASLTANIIAKANAQAAQNKITENREKLNTLESIEAYQQLIGIKKQYDALLARGRQAGNTDEEFTDILQSYVEAMDDAQKAVKKQLKELDEDLYKEANKWSKDYYFEYADFLQKSSDRLAKTAADNLVKVKTDMKSVANTQQSYTTAYLSAVSKRLEAERELAKAEYNKDQEGIKTAKKALESRVAAEKAARSKIAKITQALLDEVALAEYRSGEQTTTWIEQQEEKKRRAAEQTAAKIVKTNADIYKAEANLLKARLDNDAKGIATYEASVEAHKRALAELQKAGVQLTEEQTEALADAQQGYYEKIREGYQKTQLEIQQLTKAIADADTEEEAAALQKTLEAANARLEIYKAEAEARGVILSDANQKYFNALDKNFDYFSKTLQSSLNLMNKYSTQQKSVWSKLSSAIALLFAKAFDVKNLQKWTKESKATGKSLKELQKKSKDLKAEMIGLGGAVAQAGLAAAAEVLNNSFEAEKDQINEFYEELEARAQESYDTQSAMLKRKLEKDQISEARYTLEQMKLDKKKKDSDEKLAKEKAEKLYDVEVKQFKVNQAQQSAQAAIAGAVAIMSAYAVNPFVGAAMTPVIAALTAVQIAAILAQKAPERPKFAKGGMVDFMPVDGPSHDNGGVPVRIGNRVVAEVEGSEGALIISKRAMRNKYMRALLSQVEMLNRGISGENGVPNKFAKGGMMDWDAFYDQAKASINIQDKGRVWHNGKYARWAIVTDKNGSYWYKYPRAKYRDWLLEELARSQANEMWDLYQADFSKNLESKLDETEAKYDKQFADNEYLASMGIGSVADYNAVTADKQRDLDWINEEIAAREALADAKKEDLKASLEYDEKMAEFEKRRAEASKELAEANQAFSDKVLKEMLDADQITAEEYESYMDQITHGYGAKVKDIINLKKEEVEKVKALIEEERNAEIDALNETYDYRKDALAQIREDWETEYESITQQIIEDVEGATEAVATLTGTDLERYNQILAIQQKIKKLNEDYAANETLLNDEYIESREERQRLLDEQLRIQKELELAEEEAEKAKEAFEAEREKNMESARKQYEKENQEALLEMIKALGAQLQEEDKWSLDKILESQLNDELKKVNETYDEQIAKQDAIIEGLQTEADQIQLNYDKKIAYIKEEEQALKDSLAAQEAIIDAWVEDSLAGLRADAAALNKVLAALKVAAFESGLAGYEKMMDDLQNALEDYQAAGGEYRGKKFANGGAIELGSGLYSVNGPSHANGGVAVSIGNTKIAEVEGIEKMLAINKRAANDPEMIEALNRASAVNSRYTGVPLVTGTPERQGFSLDYDLLAKRIGDQINRRPIETYVTNTSISRAMRIAAQHKRSSFMC